MERSQKFHGYLLEEMTPGALIVGLIVLAIIIAIVVPMVHSKPAHEGFAGLDTGISAYDALSRDRPGYIKMAMQANNPLSSILDPTKVNIAKSDNPAVIDAMNKQIQATMNTTLLNPDPKSGSYLGTDVAVSTAALPPPNQIIAEAKKCQKLKGRSACEALKNKDQYKNCGICLTKGTPYSDVDPNPDAGKWIGGLLVLPDDRALAEANAGGGPAMYSATIGECTGGYLQVDAEQCTKAANRLDCEEFGESGGFGTPIQDAKTGKYTYSGVGITAEGNTPKTCAMVPSNQTYIYDPKNRITSANLRVTFPLGTGYHRIRVYDSNNKQVASSDSTENTMIVTIDKVKELNKYRVYIGMETPHMPTGQREAFIFERALIGDGLSGGGYNQTQTSAADVCSSIGARQATRDEAQDAFNNGAQTCKCSWTQSQNCYPSQANTQGCGSVGINDCASTGGKGMSWCFGVKPPKNGGDAQLKLQSTPHPWFAPYNDASPSQRTSPEQWSRFNDGNYQATGYRAIVAQWEMTSDKQATRIIPFEPTIVGVNGNNPRSTDANGAKTFNTLRRFGTFTTSTNILGPRPNSVPNMLTNQFWIWSNQSEVPTTYFDVQIPNIFMDSYYTEDRSISRAGPLIGDPFSTTLMATSPCLASDQLPGKYSMKCLTSMFVGSGGDPYAGKLALENGGLKQLNSIGDGSIDAINAYLSGIYNLIMTGKDASGYPVGLAGGKINPKLARKTINDAAQLMFGFNMVSPCEYLQEDAAGNIVIGVNPVNGEGTLDAECMDYLYMNTYSSKSRGNETPGSLSTVKSTYSDYPVSLMTRYSGLRDGEATQQDRDKWPFQACQRTGTLSPLQPDGVTVNPAAVKYVNSQAYPLTKAGYRMVDAIQMIYDGWHKTANYYANDLVLSRGKGGRAESNTRAPQHEIAVKMCYGITKDANNLSRAGCGIKARYVRVLGSWMYMELGGMEKCLQIPQLQVFTSDNVEVAKGKRTSTNSQWPDNFSTPDKAVNGNATPHTHGDGEYHSACSGNGGNMPAYKSWWMVDLGGTFEIGSVKFFPRTECCSDRQYMCPVQLLSEGGNVVAERRIWDNVDVASIKWSAPATLSFNSNTNKPRYSIEELIQAGAGGTGLNVSITNATTGNSYKMSISGGLNNPIVMKNLGNEESKVPSGDVTNSTFVVTTSSSGALGTLTIYFYGWGYGGPLVGFPGQLIMRGGGDWYAGLAPYASFKIVKALNGDPAGYSLISTADELNGMYLVNHGSGRTCLVSVEKVDINDPADVRRAVWFFNDAIGSRSVSGNVPPFTGQPLYGNIGY